jgi:hypothetical protein
MRIRLLYCEVFVNQLPFNKPGQFYRGNLHTHSTNSDGGVAPQAVANAYREAGYHFLALTDHFLETYGFPITDTTPFRTDGFTTILGAEMHTGHSEIGNLWHILAVGLPADFARYPEGETGPQLAARAMAAGAFVAAAHPLWSNLTEADVVSLGAIHAIETWNGACQGTDLHDSWYMLDLLLAKGHRYTACATDDAHFKPSDSGFATGWVWVKSEALTPDALLTNLKAGHFYSSTGPEIYDVQVEPGKRVYVRSSPADRYLLSGNNPTALRNLGNEMTETEFSLERFKSPYARLTVRDRYGRKAWTNPFWF